MIPRSFLAAVVLLAAPAWGGPPLTTVQDVLYKADGTRFNGILIISWTSFEASDQSAIATHSITTTVVDGNLRVQLVPTTSSTPAVFYSVTYNSDGRIQFSETWSVPDSAQPLRLRDVRVSPSAIAANDSGTTVQESDVIGLVADLGVRPLKGPGYAAGRVAVVDSTGVLESVSGTASDCVRVDGSSGPCGDTAPSFLDGDSPSGIVDGSNTVFTLSATPNPATSLAVYRNGLLQKVGQDYTFGGRTVQFTAAVDAATGRYSAGFLSPHRGGRQYRADVSRPAGAVQRDGSVHRRHHSGQHGNVLDTRRSSPARRPRGRAVRPGAPGNSRPGFSFEIHWGATVVGHRDAAASDTFVTGRADAGILTSGSQLSFQTWGAVLPFTAGVASAADAYATGLTIDFQGKLAQAGDTLTLANYAVVRLP